MEGGVPAYITHYHLAERPPFLNLSDLDETALAAAVAGLSSTSTKRVFGPRYMALRRCTEEKLRRLFVEAGGRPERAAPHYFVLGDSPWFRGLGDMREVRLPLADLPGDQLSITYSDSFEAMGLGAGCGLTYEPRPWHGRVYRLADLPRITAEFGRPGDGVPYDGYHRRQFHAYVEVQLWSDDPVRRWLA